MFKTGSVSTRRSKNRQNRRIMRFEPLGERCLLAIQAIPIVVTATDSVAAEGTDGNTGAWRIMRFGPDIVPCVVEFRIDGAATCGGTTDNTKNKLRSLLDHGEIDDEEVLRYLTDYFEDKVQW